MRTGRGRMHRHRRPAKEGLRRTGYNQRGPRGRAGGVIQELGGPGGSDWLSGSEVGGAAGGWAAGKGAVPSP